jgi:hypothetical protein
MDAVEDAVTAIARLHPVLEAADQAERASWGAEAPPSTVHLATLARALVEALPGVEESAVRAVLREVEAGLTMGDAELRDAMATGFLEAVAARFDMAPAARERIVAYLGPESLRYLRAWDEFTLGKPTV